MCSLLTESGLDLVAQWAPLVIWGKVWPYLVMLIGFSLIIFVHELGHFLVAKWADVRVETFAIGFGRELFGFTRGETRYSFNVLPLGGYVKMLGQEDFDDKSKELQFKEDPRSFVNKSVGRRMAIVSAGVIMNILFACFLFMLVFMIGLEAPTPRIAFVEPDSPADRAGLLPGDVVQEINGERILEFNEVRMAVLLAPLHEPIEFVVERNGEMKSLRIEPEYSIPDSTKDMRRQIVGIAPGVTREIIVVGPEIDQTRPDHPHVGDLIVEIDGVEVTDENISEVINTLVYAKGDVFVERLDPTDPDGQPRRVRVDIPPILTLYPSEEEGEGLISVLGLRPLIRFSYVNFKGRAHLAGIEAGDTILSWDDIRYPSPADIRRSIQECPERDIHFAVRKLDGKVESGFVRPKRNRNGQATIQAVCRSIDKQTRSEGGPRAYFADVRQAGWAHQAGIETGDEILRCAKTENPSAAQVNSVIRTSAKKRICVDVRKTDGETRTARVRPKRPGSIDAQYNLVADDVLIVGGIVDTIHGEPSPAAVAGLEPGIRIKAVNGEPVSRWRDLIDVFRESAGSAVELSYIDANRQPGTSMLRVPHCLRTRLGVGPEARIVSIDGKKKVLIPTNRGSEEAAVGYRKATRAILTELIGRENVTIEYRENTLGELRTSLVDVTEDMIDPWLGRIAFSANIFTAPETKLLKGENALDAILIGVHKTYYFIFQVYKILERMVFTRSVGIDSVSGPLGIIDIGGEFARSGFVKFVFFLAIISANLAVINFLPLPIVDGGLMVFLIIEKIKGAPVSLRVQVATQMVGLFLLIGFFLYITFNDAMRLWG